MERVREIALYNDSDCDPAEVKSRIPSLEARLCRSPLVQSMQTLCAHDKTQLRFWLPAQCIEIEEKDDKTFEEHLKRGILVMAIPEQELVDEWYQDALRVELCFITRKTVTDLASAGVVRLAVRVFPQCAQCGQQLLQKPQRLVCSGCSVPFYCGVECQTAHWPIHKPRCQLLRQTVAAPAAAAVEKE